MDMRRQSWTWPGPRGERVTFARAAALAALLSTPVAAQLSTLYPIPVLPAGAGSSFHAADLDLDGLTDVVTDPSLMLAVIRALPAGGFAAPVSSTFGIVSSDLTAADVNGDGWPEVIGSSHFQQKFACAPAAGGGVLNAANIHYVGGWLTGVAVGDVDGDTLPDVVTVADSNPVALNVNRGDGQLGFLATEHHPLAIKPLDVVVADLDEDGALDAIFSTSSDPAPLLSVSFGDGAGGFAAPVSRSVALYPGMVVVGDLELDGDLDLATCCASGAVDVVRGDGAGGLSAAESWPVGPTPVHLAAGDLDGDGVPDLVTADFDSDHVSLLLADGAGGYADAQVLDSQVNVKGVAVMDASADGLPDVVTWDWSPGNLGVMLGDGAGGLLAAERYAVAAPDAVAVEDLDGDARPDLVAAFEGGIAVLVADGAGGFLPPSETPYPVGGGTSRDVATGDVTSDGVPDVLALTDTWLLVLRNDGAGALQPAVAVHGSSGGGNRLALADLDGDGALDALETFLPNQAGPPFPGFIRRHLGAASGGLLPPTEFPAGEQPWGLALGDLDGDGHPDAAAANTTGPGVSILLADGLGGLSAPTLFNSVPFSRDIALGDLDLDGRLDAAVIEPVNGVGTLLLGDGAGGFMSTSSLGGVFTGDDSTRLAIADVDGDGWRDVVQSGGFAACVAVLGNDGAGGLLPAKSFSAGYQPASLAVADLDGDHHPDLVAGNRAWDVTGMLSVLRNQGHFTWTDIGYALPGTAGAPQLVGTGSLQPGSPGDLRLFHARPFALAVLFVSGSSSPAPFKGGTLVPLPPLAQFVVVTDAAGSLVLGWAGWPSAAPGQDWYFQYAIADSGAVHGVALSSALRAIEP
jgi:hypothetical protein